MKHVDESTVDYNSCFKSIYYSLYSNSSASRAESIVSDVSKILLFKLMIEESLIRKSKAISGQFILDSLVKFIPNRYSDKDHFQLSDSNISHVLKALEDVSLSKAPSHVIGDAFQSIIGSRIRGDKGQFFTPKELVECMVRIVAPSNDVTIIDPACGTGGFLSESISAVKKENDNLSRQFNVIGIDKDRDMADMALATSKIIASDNVEIYNENSLEIMSPHHRLNSLIGSADIVLTNPPFGAKIGITDESILSLYDFGHNWTFSQKENKWYKLDSLTKSQTPQILFIELCVKLLKDGGKLAIVLPEGIFGNKTLGYVWEYLKNNGCILGMIDCPRSTFQPSTDTKTNVLFYKKGEKYSNEFIVAVSKYCGHDKRGRTITSQNKPWPNDFKEIADSYGQEGSVWWKKVTMTQNYCVPRYLAGKIKHANQDNYVTIGEMISQGMLKKKSSKEIGSESYGTGDIPFIRTSDIINFEISSDPTNAVSEEIYDKYSKNQNLEEGDILFIADGRYRIGKTAIITKYNIKCLVQSHIDILSLTKKAPFTPFEFLYLLNTDDVQDQIRSMIFIQSTLGTLGNRINEIALPLPVRSDEWREKINAFQENIEMRAACLFRLKENEHYFDL